MTATNALRFLASPPAPRMVAYRLIELEHAVRVFHGRRPVVEVFAVEGVTITRVIDDTSDVFIVEGPHIIESVEIEAHNVVAGVRIAPLEHGVVTSVVDVAIDSLAGGAG